MPAAQPSNAQLAESLLAFWADGGVDAMLLDEAVDRIEAGRILPPPRPATPLAAAPAPPRTRPAILFAPARALPAADATAPRVEPTIFVA